MEISNYISGGRRPDLSSSFPDYDVSRFGLPGEVGNERSMSPFGFFLLSSDERELLYTSFCLFGWKRHAVFLMLVDQSYVLLFIVMSINFWFDC
jgi:hypothetical protein